MHEKSVRTKSRHRKNHNPPPSEGGWAGGGDAFKKFYVMFRFIIGVSCKTLGLKANRHSGQAKRDPESRFFRQFWIPAPGFHWDKVRGSEQVPFARGSLDLKYAAVYQMTPIYTIAYFECGLRVPFHLLTAGKFLRYILIIPFCGAKVLQFCSCFGTSTASQQYGSTAALYPP